MAISKGFKTFLDGMAKLKSPLTYDRMVQVLQTNLPEGANPLKELAEAFQAIMDDPKQAINADGLYQVMVSMKTSPKKRLIYDEHVLKLPEKHWKDFRDSNWIKEHTMLNNATAAVAKGLNLDIPREHRQLRIPGTLTLEFGEMDDITKKALDDVGDDLDGASDQEKKDIIELGIGDWLKDDVVKDLERRIDDFFKRTMHPSTDYSGYVSVKVELSTSSYKNDICTAEFELTFFIDIETGWESDLQLYLKKWSKLT